MRYTKRQELTRLAERGVQEAREKIQASCEPPESMFYYWRHFFNMLKFCDVSGGGGMFGGASAILPVVKDYVETFAPSADNTDITILCSMVAEYRDYGQQVSEGTAKWE